MTLVIKNIFMRLFFVCITFSCMSTQCRKEIPNETYYQFYDKVNLYPAQKSYRIGDTIWVEYTKQDKNFFDQNSKTEIHIDTAAVTIQIGMLSPDFTYPNIPLGGMCRIISVSDGQTQLVSDSNSVVMASFGCNSDNNFDFRIGYILKQKGVFEISLESVDRTIDACPNKIEKLPPTFIHFTFNLSDCNKDIYNALPHNIINFFSAQEIDNKRSFIFDVD